MFEEIRVTGLGVIDEAEFTLDPGLTVVTGETGAGKTMVVSSLGLLLGGRADAGLVRAGARQAIVEGRVRVAPEHAAAVRAVDAGAELDDGALIVTRVVSAEGRGRAHVGGRSVPVSVLSDMAEHLAAVHGQSDQQRLSQAGHQRDALDRYGGADLAAALVAYRAAYDRWSQVTRTLVEITAAARDRAQRADLLRFGLEEIERLRPLPNEDAALATEAQRLGSADALRSAADVARVALTGDDAGGQSEGATGLLALARTALESAGRDDPQLARLGERAAGLGYEAADLANELASYAADIENDPARLAAVQQRIAGLGALTRKYGPTVDDVLTWERQAVDQLAELEGDDERRAMLAAEAAELRRDLGELAGALSAARSEAAGQFGSAVTTELQALAMPDARVTAAVRQTDLRDAGATRQTKPLVAGATRQTKPLVAGATRQTGAPGQATATRQPAASVATASLERGEQGLELNGRTVAFGPHGVDTVELLLAPHPGAPPRPVHRGASGGELSRVMLAIEVVFAVADPVPTFVFDEVDAGVGGRAAVEVGARLARLARSSQVIVVTHLPQVAAFADRHLVVAKSSDGMVTRSDVVALDEEGRERELSRMLAGMAESETGRAHAAELLESAAATKRA